MFVPADGRGSRLAGLVSLPLLLAGLGYLLLSGVDDSRHELATLPSRQPAPDPVPTLIGIEARPSLAPTPPVAHEPVPQPTNAADADTAWRIDFEVEGAPWNQAIFLPSERGRPKVLVGNPHGGAQDGTINVFGPGRLLVRSHRRLTWASEELVRPASGTLALTAVIEDGLPISGTVVAADGVTPAAKTKVQVREAKAVPGIPYTGPWNSSIVTDANGRFLLTGMRPGPVTLRAHPDETLGARTDVEVQAGDTNVEIRLKPMGLVTLRVFDEATGKAPRARSIQTLQDGRPSMSIMARAPSKKPEPPLTIRLQHVAVGRPVTIRVLANGYEVLELEVHLPPEGEWREVDAPLRRSAGGEARLIVDVRFEGEDTPESVSVVRYTSWFGIGMPEKLNGSRLELRLSRATKKLVFASFSQESFLVPVTLEVDEAWTEPGANTLREVTLLRGGHVHFKDRTPGHTATLTCGNESIERTVSHPKKNESLIHRLRAGTWTFRIEGLDDIWTGEAEIRPGEITDAVWKVEPTAATPPAK